MEHATFIDRCLAGQAVAEDVDDAVDAWHECDDPRELREVLGLTAEEYAQWVTAPSILQTIISSRRAAKLCHNAERAQEFCEVSARVEKRLRSGMRRSSADPV